MAKGVLERMFASGRAAAEIVATEGLAQIDDEAAIVALIDGVLASHPDAAEQFRGGKATTLGFLVGQVMKAAKGRANPARVNELLRKALGPQT
jgi:aspartyl-tRNA(Asn)/glutamyl-tRNA(Gln) amidotransferase subunit B